MLLGWVFLGWVLLTISGVAELVLSVGGVDLGNALPGFRSDALGDLSFVNVASLVSAAASAAFVVVGLGRFRRGDRLDAYRAFDLALLVTIRYLIAQERRTARATSLALEPAPALSGSRSPLRVSSRVQP